MNPMRFLLGAVFAAILLSVPVRYLHAQASTTPQLPAFYISEFEVTDPEGIKPYSAAVESTFAPFGGRYVVRVGKAASLEGAPPKRVVMIAFPSMEHALAWYNSPSYSELKPIRHKSATSRVFVVEGAAIPAQR